MVAAAARFETGEAQCEPREENERYPEDRPGITVLREERVLPGVDRLRMPHQFAKANAGDHRS
jgi:hypothetical protein